MQFIEYCPKSEKQSGYMDYRMTVYVSVAELTRSCTSLPLPRITREYCTAYRQSRKRSKFKVQFLLNAYRAHAIVKSKNHKTNHCKQYYLLLSSLYRFFCESKLNLISNKGLLAVVVCQDCHNKIPQTGWFKQQKFIFLQFWKLKI